MDNIVPAAMAMLQLCLFAVVGAVLGKYPRPHGLFHVDALKAMAAQVFWLYTPALMVTTFASRLTAEVLRDMGSVVIAWSILHCAVNAVIGAVLVPRVVRIEPHFRAPFQVAAVFCNAASVPLLLLSGLAAVAPLSSNPNAASQAVGGIFLYALPWNILFWSAGLSYLSYAVKRLQPLTAVLTSSERSVAGDVDDHASASGHGWDERQLDAAEGSAHSDAPSPSFSGSTTAPLERLLHRTVARLQAQRLLHSSHRAAALGVLQKVLTPPVIGIFIGVGIGLWPDAKLSMFAPGGWLQPVGDVLTLCSLPAIPLSNLVLAASLYHGVVDALSRRKANRASHNTPSSDVATAATSAHDSNSSPHGTATTVAGGNGDSVEDAHVNVALPQQLAGASTAPASHSTVAAAAAAAAAATAAGGVALDHAAAIKLLSRIRAVSSSLASSSNALMVDAHVHEDTLETDAVQSIVRSLSSSSMTAAPSQGGRGVSSAAAATLSRQSSAQTSKAVLLLLAEEESRVLRRLSRLIVPEELSSSTARDRGRPPSRRTIHSYSDVDLHPPLSQLQHPPSLRRTRATSEAVVHHGQSHLSDDTSIASPGYSSHDNSVILRHHSATGRLSRATASSPAAGASTSASALGTSLRPLGAGSGRGSAALSLKGLGFTALGSRTAAGMTPGGLRTISSGLELSSMVGLEGEEDEEGGEEEGDVTDAVPSFAAIANSQGNIQPSEVFHREFNSEVDRPPAAATAAVDVADSAQLHTGPAAAPSSTGSTAASAVAESSDGAQLTAATDAPISVKTAVALIITRLVVCPAVLFLLFVAAETARMPGLYLPSSPQNDVIRLVILVEAASPSAQSVLLLCQTTGDVRSAKDLGLLFVLMYPLSLLTMIVWLSAALSIVFG